jgi:hypothetical protein
MCDHNKIIVLSKFKGLRLTRFHIAPKVPPLLSFQKAPQCFVPLLSPPPTLYDWLGRSFDMAMSCHVAQSELHKLFLTWGSNRH